MSNIIAKGRGNLVERTSDGIKKRFVRKIYSDFYDSNGSSAVHELDESEIISDPSKLESELTGHGFMSNYFPTPNLLELNRNDTSITYEDLINHNSVDGIINSITSKSSELRGSNDDINNLGLINYDIGQRLRKLHDETLLKSEYSVKGLLDFHDGNILADKSDYKIIDFESFGDINVYNSFLTLLVSQVVTASDDGKNIQDIDLIHNSLDMYCKGYFGESEDDYPDWFKGDKVEFYNNFKGDISLSLFGLIKDTCSSYNQERILKIKEYIDEFLLEPNYVFIGD